MAKRLGRWVLLCALVLSATTSATAQQWVTSWGSSHHSLSPETRAISNATIRLRARSTVAGNRVRVRLANSYGEEPLTIGAAAVGLHNNGASLVEGSNLPLRFSGSSAVTIAAGGYIVSDPVDLEVHAEQGLAVSLYVPGANVRSSVHGLALTTSYLTEDGAGDQTGNVDGSPYSNTTSQMHWLAAIDVWTSTARGAIVALGDSITDGSCATLDARDRWVDVLYTRLLDATGTAHVGMVNAGIGGNTAIRVPPVNSTPVVERLDRDVLSLAGVTHLIVYIGTNDLRRNATAEQVIAGLGEIIGRAKAQGLSVIGATIIPRNPEPRGGLSPDLGFNAQRNEQRHAVNEWIRENPDLDAVVDFDAAVKDAGNPDLINPIYDCDGIHPNVLGYAAMARAVDLGIFDVGQ